MAEVIFTMIYIAINILMWAWLIGSITLLVARGDEQGAKYRHRMHALDRYGKDKGLPQASSSMACTAKQHKPCGTVTSALQAPVGVTYRVCAHNQGQRS